jgi:ATP-binding cassette subfamily F protein 3
MSLVTISNLSLGFLGKNIFQNIGLQAEPGDRIGLIGPNGSGKTTLLRLIAGEIAPDKGELTIVKNARIGYLPQDVRSVLSGNVLQSLLDSMPSRLRLKREIGYAEKSIAQIKGKSEQIKLADKLAAIHQEMSDLDTQFPPHEAERILGGLGFLPEDLAVPVSSLSEGWKMRAMLASLLYQKPDLLLLDEPTNHLDIPSVHWLEQFLQSYKGAMILVSHDKDFLNRQIHRIISLEVEGMRGYKGNYDFYLKAREEERRILEAQARNQELKIKEAQKFIDRFRYKASKARQAQSKIKVLKKMELIESYHPRKTIHFSFPTVTRSGREVVTLKEISKGFGTKVLYTDINLTVMRGERIAIVGPNGCGKTTLLKILVNELTPTSGEILLGKNVMISYFAQHHFDMLDQRKTIVEEVSLAAPDETVGFVRNVCGAFLFSGDEVDKPIGVLSGGEKARVALAKLLVKPGNLMLMDEPSNHLDLISSEVLIDALADYKGTMIFVSHNQSFVSRLATKIWDIRSQGIEEYPGTLYEYYDHIERIVKVTAVGTNTKQVQEPAHIPHKDRKARKREKAEKRKLISSTLKPIQERLATLEARIADLETRQKELETLLTDPDIFADKSQSVPLLNEYKEVKEKILELMGRWESDHGELEEAKQNLGVS